MFDRFVVIDWSANSRPRRGRDSIWIAVLDAHGLSVSNPATRGAAEQFLVELVDDDPSGRALVGVDFSLGYPAGTAAALGLTGSPWASMFRFLGESICDGDRNSNNRFEVATALNRADHGHRRAVLGMPAVGLRRDPDDDEAGIVRTAR